MPTRNGIRHPQERRASGESIELMSAALSPEALLSWGWRIPFLLGILVGILGAYLRWRLADTPKFTEIEQHGEVAKAPLIETVTKYRRETLTIFGLTLHNTVAYYIPIIYMTSYIVSVAKLPQSCRPVCATPPCRSATTSRSRCSAASRPSSRLG